MQCTKRIRQQQLLLINRLFLCKKFHFLITNPYVQICRPWFKLQVNICMKYSILLHFPASLGQIFVVHGSNFRSAVLQIIKVPEKSWIDQLFALSYLYFYSFGYLWTCAAQLQEDGHASSSKSLVIYSSGFLNIEMWSCAGINIIDLCDLRPI